MPDPGQLSSKNISGTYLPPRYLGSVAKRGLSEDQIERVIRALGRRRDRVHQGNVLALARELGISQPALWQLLNRRTRPSYGTAEALARLEGIAVESILSGPRELAARLAREGGVAEVAVARVLAEVEPEEDHPALWWIDRMRAVALLETMPLPPAQPARPTIVPVRPRRGAA